MDGEPEFDERPVYLTPLGLSALGIVCHRPLTREERRALGLGNRGLHARDARAEFKKLANKAMIHCSPRNTLYCSFCGKSQHQVKKLIAGPTVFICDECVRLCMGVIEGKGDADTGPEIGFGEHEPDR